MAPGYKTGGRVRGVSTNKPKPIILEPTTENRELVAVAHLVRTPKAVILDAMMRFETLGLGFLARADRLMKSRAATEKVAEAAQEGHKFIVAAVECATKAAPYVHARLLSVESRGDMTADRAPFVIRAPAVMEDSSAWQAAVGAAVVDMEAAQVPSGASTEVLAHPAQSQAIPAPQAAPEPSPVVLVPDPKTSRITVMPPGPRVVRPEGTDAWLDRVEQERRRASGG
jgi:hypothetical protein